MSRLGDLAAALLGCVAGLMLPPALLRAAAAALVLLAVLAVLTHLCGRALALFARTAVRPQLRRLAPCPGCPRPSLTTPARRRLLAWLALRRPHLHTGSPSPGRRRTEHDAPLPLATPPP